LETSKANDEFIYTATELKFILAGTMYEYNRFIVVIDDIESLPHKYQVQILLQYFRFHACMKNILFSEKHKIFYTNLLVSIRPSTYRMLIA
jgi:Cdc6-like AAA superfamily ATPase